MMARPQAGAERDAGHQRRDAREAQHAEARGHRKRRAERAHRNDAAHTLGLARREHQRHAAAERVPRDDAAADPGDVEVVGHRLRHLGDGQRPRGDVGQPVPREVDGMDARRARQLRDDVVPRRMVVGDAVDQDEVGAGARHADAQAPGPRLHEVLCGYRGAGVGERADRGGGHVGR
jgi:hypothetical protein